MTGKLSWKEKYSAVLLMIIGFIYLAIWIISIMSETSGFIKLDDDKLSMSKSELLNHVRTLVTIFCCIGGSILLFRMQRTGLVFGIAVFVLFTIICCGGLYQAIKLYDKTLIVFASAGLLILLMGLIFLVRPVARQKFKAGKTTLVVGLGLAIVLGIFYFFFQ